MFLNIVKRLWLLVRKLLKSETSEKVAHLFIRLDALFVGNDPLLFLGLDMVVIVVSLVEKKERHIVHGVQVPVSEPRPEAIVAIHILDPLVMLGNGER